MREARAEGRDRAFGRRFPVWRGIPRDNPLLRQQGRALLPRRDRRSRDRAARLQGAWPPRAPRIPLGHPGRGRGPPPAAPRRRARMGEAHHLRQLVIFLKQLFQIGQRSMLRRRQLWLLSAAACLRVDDARVLVLVAVDAEQLPIRAIGWIVVVVAVLVMDRELA